MKHGMTLFHAMGTNRNILFKTHLLFMTICGLVWCSSVKLLTQDVAGPFESHLLQCAPNLSSNVSNLLCPICVNTTKNLISLHNDSKYMKLPPYLVMNLYLFEATPHFRFRIHSVWKLVVRVLLWLVSDYSGHGKRSQLHSDNFLTPV